MKEFVAVKDWESPVKAHLRGAIALVNSRRPEKVQDHSSSTIHNAVQAQIVCPRTNILSSILTQFNRLKLAVAWTLQWSQYQKSGH